MSDSDLTDEELPGYCLLHCRTPIAAFHKRHIARLCRMAGDNEDADAVERGNDWLYLGPSVIDPIVEKISERRKQ